MYTKYLLTIVAYEAETPFLSLERTESPFSQLLEICTDLLTMYQAHSIGEKKTGKKKNLHLCSVYLGLDF